jgi:hypothetical protein
VNREASSSAFALELMTLTPRATADHNISAATWRLALLTAAMSIYPFADDRNLITVGFALCCVVNGDAPPSP